MTQFALFATLLVVVVAAFILPPLWLGLRVPKARADRKAAHLAIFRDQLAELEREKAEGSLAEADFDQAKRELQRRLEFIRPVIARSITIPNVGNFVQCVARFERRPQFVSGASKGTAIRQR